MSFDKSARREKIKKKIRSKISGTQGRPRVSIFRSNTAIYAQVIDDMSGTTLASASVKDINTAKGTKIDLSKAIGKKLAEKTIEKGITEVVFDRGGYLFHGRVKALAEGAREGGLKF
ncbi:MAG: 50S ribosomal protein L18 [Cytophagales bacterium]|nr:50S ribosomal protein L18 [Cytophagales bacterium]